MEMRGNAMKNLNTWKDFFVRDYFLGGNNLYAVYGSEFYLKT